MNSKYKVTVNGTVYEVEVERLGAAGISAAPAPKKDAPVTSTPFAAPAPKPAAPLPSAPVAAPAPAPKAKEAASVPAGGRPIRSPIPGTIMEVNIKAGDTVRKGDVLMILEAMKMMNEIMAPYDGTVLSVDASVGASIETDGLLCVIG